MLLKILFGTITGKGTVIVNLISYDCIIFLKSPMKESIVHQVLYKLQCKIFT